MLRSAGGLLVPPGGSRTCGRPRKYWSAAGLSSTAIPAANPSPHRVQAASTSPISLGTAAVRFSFPPTVTKRSSSIRIPTPRSAAGAASSSAAT
jgi:hypothetical protein